MAAQPNRLEMDLMDKVRQVSDSYELNRYKALNKTIELDARLTNERLVATKLRLAQVNQINDKLSKEMQTIQHEFKAQEKKLMLTETMLEQLMINRSSKSSPGKLLSSNSGRLLGSRLLATRLATGSAHQQQQQRPPTLIIHTSDISTNKAPAQVGKRKESSAAVGEQWGAVARASAASKLQQVAPNGRDGIVYYGRPVSSSATQTQSICNSGGKATSRTRMIINDLKQRLNFVGSAKGGGRIVNLGATSKHANDASEIMTQDVASSQQLGMAEPMAQPDGYQHQYGGKLDGKMDVVAVGHGGYQQEQVADHHTGGQQGQDYGRAASSSQIMFAVEDNNRRGRRHPRLRSISLNDISSSGGGSNNLGNLQPAPAAAGLVQADNDYYHYYGGYSYVHEMPDGSSIIISCGWPPKKPKTSVGGKSARPSQNPGAAKRSHKRQVAPGKQHQAHRAGGALKASKQRRVRLNGGGELGGNLLLDKDHKDRLLVEFLAARQQQQQQLELQPATRAQQPSRAKTPVVGSDGGIVFERSQQQQYFVQLPEPAFGLRKQLRGEELLIANDGDLLLGACQMHEQPISESRQRLLVVAGGANSNETEGARSGLGPRDKTTRNLATGGAGLSGHNKSSFGGRSKKAMIVHYDLPVHSSAEPIPVQAATH